MPVNIPHRPPRKHSKNPNYHKQQFVNNPATRSRLAAPRSISIPKIQELRQPSTRLTPSAALLSISTTLPTFERQVLKEMLIDERLGKGRSIYEFKEEEKSEYDNKYGVGPRTVSPTSLLEEQSNRNSASCMTSLGFTLCDALRFFSQTGDHDTLKTQLYLLAVQRGMDVGSSLWNSIFAPFGTIMCNKISLIARRERIKNYHGIDMDNLDTEMAYGASNFFALNSILERVNIKKGDQFLDLGSGCGRAVIAASILHGHLLKTVSINSRICTGCIVY